MFVGSLPLPAAADEVGLEPFVQLAFSGTPACLKAAVVEQEVESRLGRPIFRSQGAPYALSVETVTGTPVLRITLENQLTGEILGTRELGAEAQGCDEYQAILPVVVTVLLDPYVRDREARASQEAPPSGQAAAPSLPREAEESVELARAVPPDFRCGLSGGFLAGFAPRVSAVGRQACSLRIPPNFDVDLSISYRFPGTSGGTDPAFAVQAIEGRLALCRGWGSRLRLGACGGLSLAGTIARTSAGGQAQPDDFRVIGEIALFGRLDYDFSTLGFVRFDLGLFAPLARPVYTEQGLGDLEPTRLHQASVVAGNLEVGAGFHWW